MKNISVLMLSIFLISCERGKLSDPNTNYGPLAFELTGVHDVILHQNDSTELSVELKYLSGAKQKVGLSINNLVQHYLLQFTPQLDTPSYFSTLKIITTNADTGTHSFQILATGGNNTKAYNINISVIADTFNPAKIFVGNLYETGACTNSNPNNSLVLATNPNGKVGKLHLKGIWLGGNSFEIDAYLNTLPQTVNIPSQVSNGMTFTGSGTYNNNSLQINYTVTNSFVNENCTVTLTK